MLQVTVVPSLAGCNSNVLRLWASNGLTKSALTAILVGGTDSAITIRPLPVRPLASHSAVAPVPLTGPLNVVAAEASFLSSGDQLSHACRSLIRGNIFAWAALIVNER